MIRYVLQASWLSSIICIVAGLAGCGFHLQGSSPLPAGVASMHVSYNNNYKVGEPPLIEALRQRLRRQNLLGGPGAAAQLDISRLDNSQRVISVSPVDGNAAEYELTTRAIFSYRVNGVDRLSGQTLLVTRDYSVNDTQRLASETERNDLVTSMQKELADMILMRIAQVDAQAKRQSGDHARHERRPIDTAGKQSS